MKSSHAEALKAKAAADTAEALIKIEERLSAIENLLNSNPMATPTKRNKKSEVEQAVPDKPD